MIASHIRSSWLRVWKRVFPRAALYRKSLVLILLIACIPGLLIAIGTYYTVAGGVEKDLQRMHQSQIRQRAQNIDDQLSYLEIGISHWAFDAVFDKRLKEIDFAQGYEQVRQLYDTLLVMESSHSLISRVELYLREPRPFRMTSLQYSFLEAAEAEDLYSKLEQPAKGMYWSDGLGGQLKLVNRLPGISEENLGYLVTTLDSARLNNLLDTLTPYNEGATFLLKSDGSWLAPGKQPPAGLEEAVRREFLLRGGLSGSFTFKAGDTLYSVYAGSLKRPGGAWTYVSAAPMSSVMAPVLRLSRIIAGISLGGLLLAFLLSWLGSLRLYSPVGRMVRESESIRKRLEEQLPLLRESFLLQLFQGGLLGLSEEQLRERLAELGRETGGRQAVLLLLRVRRSAAAAEGAIAGFAASECGREWLLRHGLSGDVLNLHDMSAAILLWEVPAHGSDTGGLSRRRLLALAAELLDRTGERLGLRVTLVVSRTAPEAGQLPHLFEEARQSADNRTLSADSVLIDLEQPQNSASPDSTALRYPFAREKEIVYALRSGRREETCRQIAGFLEDLCQDGGTERVMLQGMQQLYGSLRHAMLQVGLQPPRESEGGGNPYLELASLEETGQLLEWFRTRVVEPYIGLLESRREEEEGRLVQDMIRQVHDRYREPLSLDEFAEEAGANAYTVSRMFKQATGVNYIDYLTRVRLEKAKELLAGTDMRINAIAEQVGYQPTYFNRIFKKVEGITPGAYRESAGTPESSWGESSQGGHPL